MQKTGCHINRNSILAERLRMGQIYRKKIKIHNLYDLVTPKKTWKILTDISRTGIANSIPVMIWLKWTVYFVIVRFIFIPAGASILSSRASKTALNALCPIRKRATITSSNLWNEYIGVYTDFSTGPRIAGVRSVLLPRNVSIFLPSQVPWHIS